MVPRPGEFKLERISMQEIGNVRPAKGWQMGTI
jgi:hypothetical protein